MPLLKAGDKAPDIAAKDQNGNTVKLSDYQGKKVVLYFYPKDDTPGCTAEACNLRDNHNILLNKGYEVLGVSTDSEASHAKFAEKHNLPFSLLADKSREIAKAFGVTGMLGLNFMPNKRITFLINEEGTIERVIDKVSAKSHTEQILESRFD